jgi:hypothetical protein
MKKPFVSSVRRISARSIAVLLAWTLTAASPAAEANQLIFKLPDIVVPANASAPTHGTLSALLDLTGNYAAQPPKVSSLNVAFELLNHPPGVSFGAPQDPAANQLIPSGVVFAGATKLPHTIRFAKDTGVPTNAIDGSLMVTVPFTVNAGITGTFPIRFIAGNELGNAAAVALPIALVGGSITVMPNGPPIAGDYNRNGTVDSADYVVWRNAMGQSGPGLAADGNGNNIIDGGDYAIWKANTGRASAVASGAMIPAIPEPSTWLLFASCSCVCLRRARRRICK